MFALLRTLMQSTPPLGGIIGGFLLAGGQLEVAILIAAASRMVPGLLGLVVHGLSASAIARESAPAT